MFRQLCHFQPQLFYRLVCTHLESVIFLPAPSQLFPCLFHNLVQLLVSLLQTPQVLPKTSQIFLFPAIFTFRNHNKLLPGQLRIPVPVRRITVCRRFHKITCTRHEVLVGFTRRMCHHVTAAGNGSRHCLHKTHCVFPRGTVMVPTVP